MKNIFTRFKKPLHEFKPDDMQKVIGAAKRCLNTADGDILLKHLINEFKLDAPVGCIDKNDIIYVSATHDVVKYILSLPNDQ